VIAVYFIIEGSSRSEEGHGGHQSLPELLSKLSVFNEIHTLKMP
jgi:hypothetical protein